MIISNRNGRMLTVEHQADGRIVIACFAHGSDDIIVLTLDELAAIAKACLGEKP